ncbi:MAG: cell division ATP-binding protein FtsE [Enterococcus italicus]|uniref:cell division ATP-binding protein FtsE n=1 Tax=Enterococcus italicus TaxID=246144 RepID=UPI0039955433
MIEFHRVTKYFTQVNTPIKDLSFSIKQGEFVYLVGPSGAGKTSLFKLITREWTATSGTIRVGNYRLERMRTDQLYLLRRKIGMINQSDLFLPNRTIYENLAYCLDVLEISRNEQEYLITEALEDVGMENYQKYYPHEISVGQSKKIAIARALITKPPIIIADEPTANLDTKSAVEMMRLFFRINQRKTTVIVSMHDSTMVNTLRNRVIELKNGQIVRDAKEGGYSEFDDPKDVYVW